MPSIHAIHPPLALLRQPASSTPLLLPLAIFAQDRDKRRRDGNMEMVWRASKSLNTSTLAGALPVGTYCPPPRFNFGGNTDPSEPVMDDPLLEEMNVASYVDMFVEDMTEYASYVRGNHVMILMGCDYAYRSASTWYSNIDRLIKAVNADGRVRAIYSDPNTYIDAKHAEQEYEHSQAAQAKKSVQAQANAQTQAGASEDGPLSFPLFADDDFIPISQDFPPGPLRGHMYWTGYFTSRPGLKRLVREASATLRAARMLQTLAGGTPAVPNPRWPLKGGLDELAAAVGVGAHHDAITGTERQPVADDYARRISAGLNGAEAVIFDAMQSLASSGSGSGGVSGADEATAAALQACRLRNESICAVSAETLEANETLRVYIFNPLSVDRTETIVRVPAGHLCSRATSGSGSKRRREQQLLQHGRQASASTAASRRALQVLDVDTGRELTTATATAVLLPATPFASETQEAACGSEGSQRDDASSCIAQFTVSIPALGVRAVDLRVAGATEKSGINIVHVGANTDSDDTADNDAVVLENDLLAATFDTSTGRLSSLLDKSSGVTTKVDQGFYYYPASNSGPWMMRPDVSDPASAKCASSCTAELTVVRNATDGSVLEVHQRFGSAGSNEDAPAWVAQTVRLPANSRLLELEWTVGPVPVGEADSTSKEVFSRFTSDIASGDEWTTDSNGYEYMQRRRNHRSTYDLNLTEPIAANVVNVNAAIYIRDANRTLMVLNDRSQGGTSLASGQLDVFVHRRLVGCDYPGGGGVEPLNETRGFVCDPTGGVDPSRSGPGIVVRGVHRVGVAAPADAARIYRVEHEAILNAPILGFAKATDVRRRRSLTVAGTARHSSHTPAGAGKGSVAGSSSLPDNVLLLSLERFDDGSSASAPYALVRLQHRYAVDEDAELSKAATFKLEDLQALLGDKAQLAPDFAQEAVEVTITANQDISTMRKPLQWRVDGESLESVGAGSGDNAAVSAGDGNRTITLTPLKIRAFKVPLVKSA